MKLLDLEKNLAVSREDTAQLKKLSFHPSLTFEEYLDFLEEIGAFKTRKPRPIVFQERFTL